eukprot:COSAG04_NODE_222_length_19676_cov_26.070991_16_plen_216_part_00
MRCPWVRETVLDRWMRYQAALEAKAKHGGITHRGKAVAAPLRQRVQHLLRDGEHIVLGVVQPQPGEPEGEGLQPQQRPCRATGKSATSRTDGSEGPGAQWPGWPRWPGDMNAPSRLACHVHVWYFGRVQRCERKGSEASCDRGAVVKLDPECWLGWRTAGKVLLGLDEAHGRDESFVVRERTHRCVRRVPLRPQPRKVRRGFQTLKSEIHDKKCP